MEIGKVKQKRNILHTFLRVLLGMFIVTFLICGIVFSYLFFGRRDTTINNVVTTETITDESISKAEAEQRNLENVIQTPRDINTLTKDFNVTISQDTTIQGFATAKAFEISKDLKIEKFPMVESYKSNDKFAPIFYYKLDNLNDNSIDITALSSVILNEVNTYSYKMIYLDTTFSYIKDYNTLLASLKNTLSAKEVKLGIFIYPRWGYQVDYNDFLQITNSYFSSQKLNDIVSLVDEVIIQLYGFTSEYSILPGNVAPVEWAKKVVAFTAQEVTNKDKVFFEINSDYYIWTEREFSDNVRDNYSVLNIQAEVMTQLQFDSKVYAVTSSNELGDTKEVMKTLEVDESKYISISPTEENISKLIALVASYGFPGYLIK